jgi:hypothetical protein
LILLKIKKNILACKKCHEEEADLALVQDVVVREADLDALVTNIVAHQLDIVEIILQCRQDVDVVQDHDHAHIDVDGIKIK